VNRSSQLHLFWSSKIVMDTRVMDARDRSKKAKPHEMLVKQRKPGKNQRAKTMPQVSPRPSAPSLLKPIHRSQPHKSAVKIGTAPRQANRNQLLQALGAIALVSMAAGAIGGTGWLGIQMIVNPQSLSWINRILPGWIPTSSVQTAAKTLPQIRAELRRAGQHSLELIPLGTSANILDYKSSATDWLMPIQQAAPNCQQDCDRLVELRLYQQDSQSSHPLQAPSYHLLTRMELTGLEENFVIAPLVDANSAVQGSSRVLPLTQVVRYEGTVPPQGVWLNLSGRENSGGDTIAYGQILHYTPKRHHLGVKLQWTSPVGEAPVWKKITNSPNPELLINQSVGMEPQFEMYQVKPLNFAPSPVQLQPVSLAEPALKSVRFANALRLGQGRLWSTSLQWLNSLKQEIAPKDWTADAQAQMDLIRWHAQATATQAEGSWASPSQQVLANLIDGRWERALTVFEASQEARQEVAALLKADTGRLENRMKSALAVGSDKTAIKTWMAMLVAAQKGKNRAIAWLRTQPKVSPEELANHSVFINQITSAL
jgi:hypothetical protein